jgi:transposase
LDHRKVLTGILFVLKTGIPWEALPQELGCGSGMTCWQRLHELLLAKLREADKLDWSRAVVDSSSVRAVVGGGQTGPNPTDRRKLGSKHHVITDAQGILLATILTGANAHDVTQLLPLVKAISPIRGKRGRPRSRPDRVQGDRGYDSDPHRHNLRLRGIKPVLARRRTEHGGGLGVYRWGVERTLSWLHQFRRLRIRYERLPEIHEAFLAIGCALICWRLL